MQCQQRDIDAYLPGQLGTTRRKLAVQSRSFQSSRSLRAHETPQQINEGGWGVSVKGGNLGSEGLELATPDRQPHNSYRDTHLARVLARARWSTSYLGQARRSLISWMTWRIRPGATNEERVTFDNLLLPPASQPASSASRDRNGQGDAPMNLPPSRCFLQQTHWAFRDSDTLNHVGGPANSFQAICLLVTWALCSGRPHHLLRPSLLQRDTMHSTTVSIPPWQHGYGRVGSCCCCCCCQGELQSRPVSSPACCTVSPS